MPYVFDENAPKAPRGLGTHFWVPFAGARWGRTLRFLTFPAWAPVAVLRERRRRAAWIHDYAFVVTRRERIQRAIRKHLDAGGFHDDPRVGRLLERFRTAEAQKAPSPVPWVRSFRRRFLALFQRRGRARGRS